MFTYDINGNITERCEYAYTTKDGEELSELSCAHYSYDYDGDKLISCNGADVIYNALGNPTTYRGKSASWTKGRVMTAYNGISFTYDGRGRRRKKGGIEFTYSSGGKLLKQSNGLEFIYDNSGVAGIKYNGNARIY